MFLFGETWTLKKKAKKKKKKKQESVTPDKENCQVKPEV
jgi:hypothetical protein